MMICTSVDLNYANLGLAGSHVLSCQISQVPSSAVAPLYPVKAIRSEVSEGSCPILCPILRMSRGIPG
jgi:hypothetical protein